MPTKLAPGSALSKTDQGTCASAKTRENAPQWHIHLRLRTSITRINELSQRNFFLAPIKRYDGGPIELKCEEKSTRGPCDERVACGQFPASAGSTRQEKVALIL